MRFGWGLTLLALGAIAPSYAAEANKDIQSVVLTSAPSLALYDTVPLDNRGVLAGKYTIGGTTFQKTWVLTGRKRTFLTLDLGSRSPWTTFRFLMGAFAPYPGYNGPVSVEIFGDSRRLYGQSFSSPQGVTPLEVDVSKVRTLTIALDPVCATEGNLNPKALDVFLTEASFERTAAISPAPSLAPTPVRCRVPLLVQDTFTPPAPAPAPLPAPVRARW
jgi:hypothetical protein